VAHVTIDWLEAPEPLTRYFIQRGITAKQVVWDLRRLYAIRADRQLRLWDGDRRLLDDDLVEMYDGDTLYLIESI
jgi:hypothetical protein